MNFSLDRRIVKLYGNSVITYGDIKLEADQIIIDYAANTLTAIGRKDSTGQQIGYPIFYNGAEVYETETITYNFKTGRARISGVVTQQGEGYLHGETVFKNAENELFSLNNTYTTCNLADPHYHIRSKRTKAIPNDKVVSGPFNLEINDVPTPLGFPFGMFPAKQEASSGIIFPSFGEERRRGFKIEDFGYFFDINEYIKIAAQGSLYSKGGHAMQLNANYLKRYAYSGAFNFTYTKLRLSDNIEDETTQNDFRLAWNHTPQSRGTSRFSASVNAATSSYNQNNYLGVNANPENTTIDNTTRQLSSNLNYNKTFPGTPFSLSLAARHTQDVAPIDQGGGEVNLLLPSIAFNMSNVYPFKGKVGGSTNWLDKINIRYSLNGSNDITNNLGRIGVNNTDSIAPFTIDNLGLFFDNARTGFRHQIPLSTSFKLFNYFTGSPSINYEERWYFEKLEWVIDPENPNRAIISDTIPGFNRVYDYNFSLAINTRLYGTYFFKKGKVQAIRHIMNPTFSFSYRPDFGDEKFGYYQTFETEDGRILRQSRYQGFLYNAPAPGESGSIGFGLTNQLEMKVKSDSDTTDQARKVPIFNTLGFNTAYNIVADSFKLAPISWRANTSILKKKVNINLSGSIDPYVYRLDSTGVNSSDETVYYQRRVNEFAWNNGQGIGQLSRASIAISTNLNPAAQEGDDDTREEIINSNIPEYEKDFLLQNPDAYVNFNIPWSLRINYTLNYTRIGFRDPELVQSIRLSGDFSLTEKWKFTYNTGYDFESKALTQTNLGISRDLHCWELNVNWTPFGFYQSYNFTIRVKSSLLQDLKLNRTRSFFDQ
jgi:lipopolysaccharide assembly outer membrane protein LptD (OstA)